MFKNKGTTLYYSVVPLVNGGKFRIRNLRQQYIYH